MRILPYPAFPNRAVNPYSTLLYESIRPLAEARASVLSSFLTSLSYRQSRISPPRRYDAFSRQVADLRSSEEASRAGDVVFFIYSLHSGGAARVVSHLANAWVTRGGRVVVITETAIETDQYELDCRVIRLTTYTAEPGRHAVDRALGFLRKVWRLRCLLKKLQIKSVVSFLCRNNNIAALATIGTKSHLVVSERNDPRFNPDTYLDRVLRSLLYRHARSVVVQTPAIEDAMRSLLRLGNIKVIPNPIVPRLEGGSHSEIRAWKRSYILGVGRLVPQKGFDLLISAYAESTCKQDHDLVILGEGPERPRLERQISSLGLDDRVFLAGHFRDPFAVISSCSVFVLSSRYEGFPNVLVEAMSAGCAVVTFDFPSGAGDIVHHGVDGLIVPLGDVEELRSSIDRLTQGEALRRTLQSNAKRVTARFSVDAIVQEWQRLL